MSNRLYTTRRSAITEALKSSISVIDGSDDFLSQLYSKNIFTKLVFPDEIRDWPTVCITAGPENRQYLPGNIKERYLTVNVRVYTHHKEMALLELDKILEDIETVLDGTNKITYNDRQGNTQGIKNISVININTDEGALAPLAVGEMELLVHY